MASRDVQVKITSQFEDRGFKSAEASARVLERELAKVEQAERRMAQAQIAAGREMAQEFARREAETRRMAQLQMQAAREMAAAEAEKARAVEEANRRQSEAMQAYGRTITLVSLAAAAGMALTVKAAMDWESAFAGVRKTVDGTDEEIASLEGELRKLATTLPATHQEIAAVAEAAGQLGVARADVASFTETMIMLGETTNLTADAAATELAQFSNIMGVSAKQAGNLGSALVALGNDGASTEAQISAMAQRIAGAGRTVGMTSSDVLGFAAALSNVGIEAEAGGTAISRVMLQINSDVESGADTLEGYARVAGMTAQEFATAWRQDAAGALTAFIEGLGRVQQEGGNTTAVLEDLGFSEVRVSDALRRLSLSGTNLADSLNLSGQAFAENSALLEEFGKRAETAEARMQVARNQINDAAIDIGGNLLPAVATAAEAVGNLATGFGMLPEPVQKWVVYLGAAGAALGLISGAALQVIPRMAELASTITALQGGSSRLGAALGTVTRVLTGPWGLAIAAAGIAAAGLLTMFGSMSRAQEEAKRSAQELADTFDEATGAMTDYTRQWFYAEASTRGYVDAAKELGINLGTLVDALMGNAEAAAEVEEAMGRAYSNRENLASLDRIGDALGWSREQLEAAKEAWADNEEAMGGAAGAADDVADSTDGATDALSDEEKAAQEAADAIDDLIEATEKLAGLNRSMMEAGIQYEAALDEVGGKLDEIREKYGDQARTLDINTEAGRANAEVLLDLAAKGEEYAASILRQTGSQDQYAASLAVSRQALFDTARQFFDTDEAAWAYVDTLLQVPPTTETLATLDVTQAISDLAALGVTIDETTGTITIDGNPVSAETTLGELIGNVDQASGTVTINGNRYPADLTVGALTEWVNSQTTTVSVDANTAPAEGAVNSFILANQGRSVTVTVNGVVKTLGAKLNEDGGVVDYYAAGGTRESHVAQIAPAGTWRVWAEPETGGEAYIPLAPSKRARSEAILEDVADRFGMRVERYGSGGISGGSRWAGDIRAALDGATLHLGRIDPITGAVKAQLRLEQQRRAGVR